MIMIPGAFQEEVETILSCQPPRWAGDQLARKQRTYLQQLSPTLNAAAFVEE